MFKKAVLILTCILSGIVVLNSLLPGVVVSQHGSDRYEIKVYVGDPDRAKPLERPFYRFLRHNTLRGLCGRLDLVEALVLFGDFNSPIEAEERLKTFQALELFVSNPETTGGGGTFISEGETIVEAYDRWVIEHLQVLEKMENLRIAQGLKTDDLKVEKKSTTEGKIKIIAIRVRGAPDKIVNLISKKGISLVDPLFNEKAENIAKERQVKVQYLCIPQRPDGKPF